MSAAIDTYSEPDRERAWLFNHDILSCTHESIVGNHLYSGRALGLTHPGDIIQLHPLLQREWPAITAHYQRIGLSYTEDVIWDVAPERSAAYGDYPLSVFYFGDDTQRYRPDGNWYGVTAYINDKNNFVDLANQLGMTIPRTLNFHAGAWPGDLAGLPYPCYVKAAISVAGIGIYRCTNGHEVVEAITELGPLTPYQIQAEIPAAKFLNLQYQVDHRGLHRLAASEQILEGYSHVGNRHPARHAPWSVVDPMARWLFERGMKGVFAFDVAVTEQGWRPSYWPIECNPRFNGASYPTLVAQKLCASQWLALQLSTNLRSLEQIDLSGIEYNPISGCGVAVVNWGSILVGKLGVLLVGNPIVQQALAEELRKRLA